MKSIILGLIISFLINISSLFAQNVRDGFYYDGFYIPEKGPIINNNIRNYFHNSLFVTQLKIDSIDLKKIDSTLRNQYNYFQNSPLIIKDCIFFNPTKDNFYNYEEISPKDGLVLPYSLRFYIDTSNISINKGILQMQIDSTADIPFSKYLNPFYFRKYEVSNKEYREFVHWVRDSIARYILVVEELDEEYGEITDDDNVILNWDKPIPWEDSTYLEYLEHIYLPEHPRFYRKKQIDARKLDYSYYVKSVDSVVKNIVNVYPDTNCWINDFPYAYNEPLTKMYFWHPAYDNYPVVGVSYHQANAFLNWKTDQHQKELNKKGIKVKIKYDLPTEAEWEMAATTELRDKKISIYNDNYYYLADDNWTTDLLLTNTNIIESDSIDNTTNTEYINYRNDMLFETLKRNFTYKENYKNNLEIDDMFHTYLIFINKTKKTNPYILNNIDDLGICFMGGNVSEWLKESYQESWKPIFDLRQSLLSTFSDEDIKILSKIEIYFDEKNDKNGMLVRGSNWYDERFSNKFGKNVEGTNAKRFVDPNKSYSTLGFRYVIHVTPIVVSQN